ncbi:hypothetical protein O1L60_37235 [Streptomyces diastatochromogenes]|nr:hypothetical protein [Streptomyces diastatochromogenes]
MASGVSSAALARARSSSPGSPRRRCSAAQVHTCEAMPVKPPS